MKNYIYITLFLLYFAGCSKAEIDFTPLYYNVLQLTGKQISEIEYMNETNKDVKSILDKRQKAQYRIINHLEKIEKSRKEKNYCKLNPRMSVFGNLDK